MKAGRPLGLLAVVAATAGCMLPTYHLPAGYSSSYHRHLDARSGLLVPASGTVMLATDPDGNERIFHLPVEAAAQTE